ncbi:MAG: cohesin domain-containing protein [Patescibacteria group bacterium]|nr:cohesin domain-containing protein [Patescibacteria group bacterium]
MEEIKEEKIYGKLLILAENIAKFLAIAVFIFLFFGVGRAAQAASFYLSPASGSYETGKSFSVNINVSSPDQAMNAVSGAISFPAGNLEVSSISKSGSIVSLWVQEPSFSNNAGTINFEAIVLNPGYTGSAGRIITINFKAKDAGIASVIFSSGAILANDGQGTNILTGMGSGSYTVTKKVTAPEVITPAPKKEEPAAAVGVSKPQITSPTHPDQTAWYENNKVAFKWELPYGTTGVSILLNDKPTSDPGPISDGLFSTKDYEGLEDGVWYLHLKFKSQAGWGEIDRYKIQIDATPPLAFTIDIDTKDGVAWPVLHFKTTDAASGIREYKVKIDGQEFIVGPEDASLQAPPLSPGKYTAIVKAVDKAGNETLAFADFDIEPIEAPVIVNYSREFKSSDQFFITGAASPEVTVNVFIQNEKTGQIIKQSGQSDKNGNWALIYQEGLDNGRYFAWAEAVNSSGMRSESSNKVSFLVTPPVFVKFGSWAINYFTIFIILLIFVILVIALLAYWAGMIKGKLKKETDEAQKVLRANLKEFRKLIEKESAYLESLKGKAGYEKERAKIKRSLKGRVDFIEKKVMKEIKDVQDLLK